MNPFVFYPKHLSILTGKAKNAVYKLYNKIKKETGVGEDKLLTIDKVCKYMDWDRKEVEEIIKTANKRPSNKSH
jgi:hypothetical protein